MAANPCQACGACPITCALPFWLRNLDTHRHPNCVSIMGVVTSPPCLVTEYCELGSLTSLLWAAREDPEKAAALTWSRRLSMVSLEPCYSRQACALG